MQYDSHLPQNLSKTSNIITTLLIGLLTTLIWLSEEEKNSVPWKPTNCGSYCIYNKCTQQKIDICICISINIVVQQNTCQCSNNTYYALVANVSNLQLPGNRSFVKTSDVILVTLSSLIFLVMDYLPNHSHAGLYLFRILHSTQDTVHEQQACHMVVLFASAQGLANMYTILTVCSKSSTMVQDSIFTPVLLLCT